MSLRTTLFITAFLVGASSTGCKDRNAAVPVQGYVAKVGDQVITTNRLLEALLLRGGESISVFQEYTNRLVVLDELLRTELIVAHARKEGFLDRSDIADAIKSLVATRYVEEVLSATGNLEEVDGAEALAYYESHPELFRTPELARVAVIYLSVPERADGEARAAVKRRADQLRDEALAQNEPSRHFGELAARHSDDQVSRYKGGDAGWITRNALQSRWPEPALAAIFSMETPGELSPVIETERGFYLFRLMEYQPSSRLPFDLVERNVAHAIVGERRQSLLEKMVEDSRRTARVTIKEDVLRSMEIPQSKTPSRPMTPPAMPNG